MTPKLLCLTLLIVCAALPALAAGSKCKPLEYRVWQLQDYNVEHMRRLIDLATAAGVSRPSRR